jgi:hypothetical protein
LLGAGILLLTLTSLSARSTRPHYAAVEVNRFVADPVVGFPPDYQILMMESLITEIHSLSKKIEVVREGEPLPENKSTLRITGVVTGFKLGSRTKRALIGFGAGAASVEVEVKFTDAKTNQVVLDRKFKARTWSGIAGGNSIDSAEGIGFKIADKLRWDYF